MARLFLAALGVILLAIAALALVWLLGQMLSGLGVFVSGTAAVLWRLLGFLILAGGLGGLVYFLTSAWRPSVRVPAPPESVRPKNVRLKKPSTRVKVGKVKA
ncbi:hypothetical protein [Deinococcus arenicola]|uniref:Uncharacterized protein n=1 Tax=Deinococcus arenicola TaxID=2994950 RepID=A0ABU4DT52_9DEIO|nr:hypothetical protein [Deinococcus sp. ZS9-10]MDV6375553.1 hypothetical protein [Deinococcus sp. ZS9-10]